MSQFFILKRTRGDLTADVFSGPGCVMFPDAAQGFTGDPDV